MTPRQARTARRTAERKARKAEMRRQALNPSSDPHGAPAPLAAASGFVSQSATPSRAAINRANAQHSTGPVTAAGKLASSRNSLRHGLTSGTLIISGEDPAAFESLLHDLLNEHQPSGPTEELLINEMAQSYWLAQRALRLQNECFTADGVDDKRLSLYMRYHSTHERAFHKAMTALMKLKKEQSRGFVSQTSTHRNPDRQGGTLPSGFVPQSVPESPAPLPEIGFVRQKEHAEAA